MNTTEETDADGYTHVTQTRPEDGKKVAEYWHNPAGQLDHGGDPSVKAFDPDTGRLTRVEFHSESRYHNTSGPAVQVFSPSTGATLEQHYALHGEWHRSGDNPAVTICDDQGRLLKVEYWVNGKLHRGTGPAVIHYNAETGERNAERFFTYGQEYFPRTGPNVEPT